MSAEVATIEAWLRRDLPPELAPRAGAFAHALAMAIAAANGAGAALPADPELVPLLQALEQRLQDASINAQGSSGFVYRPGQITQVHGPQRNTQAGQYYEGPVIHLNIGADADPALVERLAQVLGPALATQRTVSPAELRALQELVEAAGLSAETVADTYRASLPRFWIETYGAARGLPPMLDQLAQAPRPPAASAPLIQFAARIRTAAAAPELQARLQGWIDTLAPRLGQPTPTLPGPASDPRPYLLVCLRRDEYNQQAVRAALCLVDARNPGGVYLHSDEQPRSLSSLGDLIDDCLLDLLDEDERFPTSQLRFEFFLPRELIDQPIESLPLRQGSKRVSIGLQYPVVIRSLERAFERHMRSTWDAWRVKWGRRAAPPPRPQLRPYICWPSAEVADLRLALSAEHAVSLALVQAPPPLPAAADPLREALDTGVPIALWPAAQPAGLDLKQALGLLLSQSAPDELPETLLQLRREAQLAAGQPHIGQNLRLLWDDPERLPPDARRRKERKAQ